MSASTAPEPTHAPAPPRPPPRDSTRRRARPRHGCRPPPNAPIHVDNLPVHGDARRRCRRERAEARRAAHRGRRCRHGHPPGERRGAAATHADRQQAAAKADAPAGNGGAQGLHGEEGGGREAGEGDETGTRRCGRGGGGGERAAGEATAATGGRCRSSGRARGRWRHGPRHETAESTPPPAVAAQQEWESLGKRIAGRGWRGCLRRTRGGPSGSRLRCGREPTPAASGDWPDGHRRRGAEPPDVACAPAVVGCGARSAAMNLPVTWHGQPPSRGRGGCTRRYGSGEVGFL